jgi:hypothetical protein
VHKFCHTLMLHMAASVLDNPVAVCHKGALTVPSRDENCKQKKEEPCSTYRNLF